jgi:hypothetical protein
MVSIAFDVGVPRAFQIRASRHASLHLQEAEHAASKFNFAVQ